MRYGSLAWYRALSLVMAAVFALAGGAFLLFPGGVLSFFNALSRRLGMIEAPATGATFFLVLAVAYMYLVTALAWSMYRSPKQRIYPLLLCQAKGASSLLSFGLFAFQSPLLIYLANGVVDGALSLLVLLLFLRARASPGEDR